MQCLNEAEDGSCKEVFKAWEQRLDKDKVCILISTRYMYTWSLCSSWRATPLKNCYFMSHKCAQAKVRVTSLKVGVVATTGSQVMSNWKHYVWLVEMVGSSQRTVKIVSQCQKDPVNTIQFCVSLCVQAIFPTQYSGEIYILSFMHKPDTWIEVYLNGVKTLKSVSLCVITQPIINSVDQFLNVTNPGYSCTMNITNIDTWYSSLLIVYKLVFFRQVLSAWLDNTLFFH